MVDLKQRRRHVDLDSLSEENFEEIMKQLGERFRKICDDAAEEANRLAEPYGFKVKLQFMTEPLNKEEQE